jgi:hypothetical protein
MLASVEKLLSDIERLSGRPVLVQEVPSLRQTAAISYARHGVPAHILRYRPQGDPSYQIAVQAGFALRFFSVAPNERMDFTLPTERCGKSSGGCRSPARCLPRCRTLPKEYIFPPPP